MTLSRVTGLAAAAALALLAGCSSGGGGNAPATDTTTTTTTPLGAPSTTSTSTVTAAPPAPLTTFGDGSYVVGRDITPGVYHSDGAAQAAPVGCYWERAKDTSGAGASILENHLGPAATTVTIADGDGAFRSVGCKTWTQANK